MEEENNAWIRVTAAGIASIYRNGQDAFSQKRKPERKEETIFQTNFV